MPQMSPMWWTTLFSMFIISYILFMIITYFFNIYQPNNFSKVGKVLPKNLDWKW